MKTNKHNEQPEESVVEYIVETDEFNLLDEVYDGLFEQIEKELRN